MKTFNASAELSIKKSYAGKPIRSEFRNYIFPQRIQLDPTETGDSPQIQLQIDAEQPQTGREKKLLNCLFRLDFTELRYNCIYFFMTRLRVCVREKKRCLLVRRHCYQGSTDGVCRMADAAEVARRFSSSVCTSFICFSVDFV